MVDVRLANAGAAADEIHARCAGGPEWCVGTSADPERHLATVCGASLAPGRYAIVQCTNAGVALAAARLLREEHGYQGTIASTGRECVYLFAYARPAAPREQR